MCRQLSCTCRGSPCTPLGLLHHGTKLLQDKIARQFSASVRSLAHSRPAVAIFENVLGIKRALSQVTKAFECGGAYCVVLLEMSPTHLGEPPNRPRLYFVTMRKDVAIGRHQHVQEAASFVRESLREEQPRPCDSQLLPNSPPPSHGQAFGAPKSASQETQVEGAQSTLCAPTVD